MPAFAYTPPTPPDGGVGWGYGSARCLVRGSSGPGSSQQGMRQDELVLPRTCRSHRHVDPAYTGSHQRADLQQLQPDRAAGGGSELGMRQPDPTQPAQQHIGETGKPQPQLIG